MADQLRLDERRTEVLRDALECHVGGLEEAYKEATMDRTVTDPQDLVDVTRSILDDKTTAEEILEELDVHASH
jgi:ATP-dependent exoDNAse (exonuclease V) beta subunit